MFRTVGWLQFRDLIDTKSIQWQYATRDSYYELTGYQGPEAYQCNIARGTDATSDLTDFETNYKAGATPILTNDTKVVNNITNPISIVQVPAVVPGGGTKVSQPIYSSISNDTDTTYTIPTGETLVIQSFCGGCEFKSQGSAIELWYDSAGNGVGMTIVDVIHTNGSSEQHSIYAQFEGNGTRKIRMRRRAYGGGSREVFGRWEGYY